MRPSPRWFHQSFTRRSMNELKRLSSIVMNSENLDRPVRPYVLLDFSDPNLIDDCKVMSDREIGGSSTASLAYVGASESGPAHARFSGNISVALPEDRPTVQRTGYAAFRSRKRPFNLFSSGLWDIDPYIWLALNVKSDGRRYLINVQTDSLVETDIHQHRLYCNTPGKWETVLFKWHEFVRTNHGTAINPPDMLRQKVKTLGIGLIDRQPGPFELCVGSMWASNGLMTEESAEGDAYRARVRKHTNVGEMEAMKGIGIDRKMIG